MPTHFQIVHPRSAAELLPRITDTERNHINSANVDRLDYIRQTDFIMDGPPTMEAMLELQEMIRKEFYK